MSADRAPRPVHIVTDSTSDIPPERLAELPVSVVPLKVDIGGQVYRDLIDLSREEFLQRLTGGEMPKTSQPAVGEFQTVYRELVEQGNDVVAIHISPKLSGTFNSAVNAAKAFSADQVFVVDSRTVSIGLGVLVLEAAEMAKTGTSGAEIVAHVERRADDVWIVAALETLEYLRRGGRIGPASAFLGSVLQFKPVVRVRDGEILPLERVRTFKRALERLVALSAEQAPFDRLAVLHLGAPDGAADLVRRMNEIQPDAEIILGQMGTVVGTYGGPGILGIAGLMRRPESSA